MSRNSIRGQLHLHTRSSTQSWHNVKCDVGTIAIIGYHRTRSRDNPHSRSRNNRHDRISRNPITVKYRLRARPESWRNSHTRSRSNHGIIWNLKIKIAITWIPRNSIRAQLPSPGLRGNLRMSQNSIRAQLPSPENHGTQSEFKNLDLGKIFIL